MFNRKKKNEIEIIKQISEGEFFSVVTANGTDGSEYKVLTDKLIKGKEDISTLIKNVFQIATSISAFDLRLSFYSEIMSNMSEDINTMSDSLNISLKEASLAINEITSSNSELILALSNISERSRIISDSVNNSSRKLEEIRGEGSQVLKVADNMKKDFDSLSGIMNEMDSTV